MVGRLSGLTFNKDSSQNITVTVGADFSETYDKLKDLDVEVEIKKATLRRSLDANSYFWHLCSEIAKNSSKYSNKGKLEVYKEAIKAKGEFEPMLVKKEAVERLTSRWSENGSGWFVEVVDKDRGDYCVVHSYYGSSTYDSLAMSHIIDYVVNIANDLGIPTITEKEKEKMLCRWERKKGKHE